MDNLDKVTIRKLLPSDLQRILEISRDSLPDNARYKRLSAFRIGTIYLRLVFEKWASRIGNCVRYASLRFLLTDVRDRATFVAQQSSELVGFAEAYPIDDCIWLLDAIAVLPNYRRRGIGIQLMTELISHIGHRGGRKIQLYVEPDNLGARKLYTRLGFRVAAQPISMTKDLSEE